MSTGFIDMMLKTIMSDLFIWVGKNHATVYAALGIVDIKKLLMSEQGRRRKRIING
ncbi:Uncharacterised protein [Enterobacter cloacae]|nr:Uncharacterised protein [Enterobacter cloacae]